MATGLSSFGIEIYFHGQFEFELSLSRFLISKVLISG